MADNYIAHVVVIKNEDEETDVDVETVNENFQVSTSLFSSQSLPITPTLTQFSGHFDLNLNMAGNLNAGSNPTDASESKNSKPTFAFPKTIPKSASLPNTPRLLTLPPPVTKKFKPTVDPAGSAKNLPDIKTSGSGDSSQADLNNWIENYLKEVHAEFAEQQKNLHRPNQPIDGVHPVDGDQKNIPPPPSYEVATGKITSNNSITYQEDHETSAKLKRKLSNRISAKRARDRKKLKLEFLTQEINRLNYENAMYSQANNFFKNYITKYTPHFNQKLDLNKTKSMSLSDLEDHIKVQKLMEDDFDCLNCMPIQMKIRNKTNNILNHVNKQVDKQLAERALGKNGES